MDGNAVVCGACGTKIIQSFAIDLANRSDYIQGSQKQKDDYENFLNSNSKKWYEFWK